jgi:hypothetical protein
MAKWPIESSETRAAAARMQDVNKSTRKLVQKRNANMHVIESIETYPMRQTAGLRVAAR